MSVRWWPAALGPDPAPLADRAKADRRRGRAVRLRIAVDGRSASNLASAVFAAALGGLLVGAALPRIVTDAIVAPHDGALSRLEAGRPVSTAELAAAAIALQRALALRESAADWMALAAVETERARRTGSGRPAYDVFLDRAVAAFRHALAHAPARPAAWTALSEAVLARGGLSPAVAAPLGMAIRTGRVDPPLTLRRLVVGLTAWPALDPATRALVANQVRIAVDRAPRSLAALARHQYLLRPIRSALAADPTRLARFDAAYLSDR